jgi:hypothetical protein
MEQVAIEFPEFQKKAIQQLEPMLTAARRLTQIGQEMMKAPVLKPFPAPQMLEVFKSVDVEGDVVGDLYLGVLGQVFDESLRRVAQKSSDRLNGRLLFHLRSRNRMVAWFAGLSSTLPNRQLRPRNRRRPTAVLPSGDNTGGLAAAWALATIAVQESADDKDLAANGTGERSVVAVPVF